METNGADHQTFRHVSHVCQCQRYHTIKKLEIRCGFPEGHFKMNLLPTYSSSIAEKFIRI